MLPSDWSILKPIINQDLKDRSVFRHQVVIVEILRSIYFCSLHHKEHCWTKKEISKNN